MRSRGKCGEQAWWRVRKWWAKGNMRLPFEVEEDLRVFIGGGRGEERG